MDARTWGLLGVVVGLLSISTAIGRVIKYQTDLGVNPAAVEAFNSRLRAWWMICSFVALAFFMPPGVIVALFGFLAFWALREFITLTPTRLGDHRALFWVFFLFTPLQFVLVGLDREGRTYPLYSMAIPVYGSLFVAARVAMAGDSKRFLERVAKIQSGMLICVYCLSFAPALLYLRFGALSDASTSQMLLFFFVVMVLLADALQFISNRMFGRHVIAPQINSTRTWEGLVVSVLGTGLVGMLLWWATPFRTFPASGLMSALVAVMGFAGGMTMSAIKRDRGVQDYGTLVEGHGGVLDRIDSICFAAPVFYHVTRYFYGYGS